MKHLKFFVISIITSMILLSCSFFMKDAKLSNAEQSVEDFFTVMEYNKKGDVLEMYPDFNYIVNPYYPDSIVIENSNSITETLIKVEVTAFTFDSTEVKERDIVMYVNTDSIGNFLSMRSSLGFCKAEEHEFCVLAEKIGAASIKDTTDFMIQDKLVETEEIYESIYSKVYPRYEGVEIVNSSWKQLDGGAQGTVTVVNDSKHVISNLKYCIEVLDSDGNVILCDTSDVNIAGDVDFKSTVSDKFTVLYPGKAKKLDINLLYDAEELAKKEILNGDYSGNEYRKYIENIKEEKYNQRLDTLDINS